jgi:hypothetical protein
MVLVIANWHVYVVTHLFIHVQFMTTQMAFPFDTVKANSQIPCRSPAMPCRVNSHMLCRDSAVFFVKVRVVTGNIQTASPTA